jgi:predicted nucleic acid-binding protein
VIFVDCDVPMLLVGTPHRFKVEAQKWLEISITEGGPLVTDAAVLHEILRRYVAIDCREAIQPCLDVLLGVVDEVLPIDAGAVERAKTIVFGHPRLSARTALHLAVMERHGVDRVMSFDTGFDAFPGIQRVRY